MDEKYLQDFYNRIVNRDPSYKEKMPFETFKVKMQDEAYNTKMQNWIGGSTPQATTQPPQQAGVNIDAFLGKEPVKKKEQEYASLQTLQEVEPTLASSSEDVSSASSSQSENYYQQLGNLTQGTSSDATRVSPAKKFDDSYISESDRAANIENQKKIEIADLQKKQQEDLRRKRYFDENKKEESFAVSQDSDFKKTLSSVNPSLIAKDESTVVSDMTKMFGRYGFLFEETGAGDAMIVSSNGGETLEVDLQPFTSASEVSQSATLKKFLNDYGIKDAKIENKDFISKALKAQNSRKVAVRNPDGTESTVKFTSYEEDGKNFVVPTLFPIDPSNYTSDPKTWKKLGIKEAIALAKKRNEVYSFDTAKEADEFAKGSWKDINTLDAEADKFYKERGHDYAIEKRNLEKYQELSSIIDFIQKDTDGEELENEAEMMRTHPELFIKGMVRSDANNYIKGIVAQRDALENIVNDNAGWGTSAGVEETRANWDAMLSKRSKEISNKAANDNRAAIELNNQVNDASLEMFNVPIEELIKYRNTDPSKQADFNKLLQLHVEALKQKKAAASQFDMAQTYLDERTNKMINSELVQNGVAFYNSNVDAWNNGQIGATMLKYGMGMTGLKESAEDIAKRNAGMTGTQSYAMARMNNAETFMEGLMAFGSDPFEIMLTAASNSISSMLPAGVYIIPAATATGAGLGAGVGAMAVGVGAGPGAISGGIRGFRTGMALTNGIVEYNTALMDAVSEMGYNPLDPESLMKALEDQAVWDKGRDVGLARGIPITAMDYITGGLAGRLIKPASMIASTASKAAHFIGERVVLDTGAEMLGEATAQASEMLLKTGREKFSGNEIAMEGLGHLGGQTPNALLNIYQDTRNNTNIDIAKNFTDISIIASESASDGKITAWANNMEKLGKIDKDVNKKIQENVGLRREAREILEVAPDGKKSKVKGDVLNRTMELMDARAALTATTNKREVFRDKVSAINKEISIIAETKKLVSKEDSVDLSLVNSKTKTDGASEYMIDGRRFTKAQFIDKISKFAPERFTRAVLGVKNDEETARLVAEKINLFPNTEEKLMPIEEIFENADSESLKNKESTAKALESLAADKTEGSTFTDNEGNALPVVGNENTLAELYHEAVDTPMEQRTEAQNSAMDVVKKSLNEKVKLEKIFVEDTAPTQDDSRSASNKSDMGDMKGRVKGQAKVKVIESAQRAIKTLKSILPNFDIHIHEDEGSYNAAMQKLKGQAGSKGNFYSKGDGTGRIDINLSRASATTVAHEVAHGVMLKVFGDNPALFKKFRENISKVLKDDKNKALNEFADRYGDDVQHEEYLVQLTAILEQEQDSISTTTVQKIAAIINKVLSTISGGKIVAFQDITETKELIEFLNKVSGSIREGGDIDLNQSIENLINQEPYSEGIAIQADPNAEYSPISKSDIGVYEDFPKELLGLLQLADVPINTLKEKIKEYGGRVLITTSDATGYGVDNKGRAIVGGYGFSLNKKNVDAGIGFANVNAATVKKLFTTARKKYGEKKVLVLIMIQSPDTTINNSYGVTYFIESLKKLKNLDNVKAVTEKFGNEKLSELIGSVNDKTDTKEFVKKFIDITTFIERKEYLKKIIPSGKGNRKGVQDFNDINVNIINFLKEYGDKSFMTPEMIDKNDGNFVVGGFEINVLSKKENDLEITDIQGKGIEHPLFNAKVPGINHFKLDGPYDVQKNFEAFATPETQIDYTKTTEEEITKLINEKYSDDKYYEKPENPKNYSNLKADNKIIFKKTIPSLLKEVTPKIPRNVASGRNFTVDIKEIENIQKSKFEKRPTDGQSKSQLDNKKEAPKFVRDISALITPATVRGFNPLTKRIKKLSLKYDDLVKQYAKNKDPKILAKIKTAEAQILNDAKQEIVDAIAKVDGVSVQFKDAKRGLWENKFEPSFNMNLSISPQADTKKISDLLFDFATKYSQDAFILETESEFEEDVFSGKREIPLTEFDKNDLMHYPQIIYTFDTPITDEQVADLSVALEKEGVSAFSINNNAVQVSVIKFLSPEEEANLTKDKQYEERKRDLDSKSIATAKATYDVLGSNGKGTSSIRIKKSSYQGAINEKSADQTRQFDRSDVLKAFKESTTKIEKLAVELANLRQKEINLKKEGKELSVKGKAKFDKLVKQIQPVIQRTFETNKKLYEDSKIEVEGIAQDAIEQVDASISPFPIKRAERASVKTIRWYNSFTERLGDGARVNIVTDTDVDADKVFEIIDKKYPVDKELRRISETTDLGYPKRLIEIRTSNGVIAEIQVITNEAYLAKDGVKGFTGDKKQKATAKQKLDGVRSRLGWSIPDGLGHYFYEIQRDTNVDENLRDEAARLSDIYYDAFTNPKSKLKESFMKDVMSFKEQVDAADKSKWDVGNIGKAPESITEGTSKSQKGDEKRDVEIENILNPKHKGFGKRMELAEKKKIGTSQTFKEDKNVNYVFRNTTKEEVDNVLSGKEKTGDFWRSEPNEYKNYGDYVIIKKAPNLKEYSRNYSKGNKIENDGFNYVGEKVGKEDIDFIYNKKTGEIIYNNNPELVNAVEQSLPTQETEGSSKSQLTEKNISEMVKKARAEGLSDEAIRKRLLSNGISSSDIDIAMESTETSSSKIEVNEQRMPGYDAMLSKVRGIREKSAARGRSENDTNNSVMAYVMGSDVYKNASDIQREAIVRQIRKYFGLREKSAPKVTNLLDGDMVTVSSKVLVLEKIKALVRGGKDAVKAIKAAQEQLRKEIKELRKSGKITVAQLERVIGRLGKTDLLSPTATARFIDYMGKVFADAEYGQKISDAYKTRSQILSLTKNKDKNVDLKTLGVEFAKIDPSMVEDIDAYNDMAKSIEEAIRGSTIKKDNVKIAASVKIDSAMEYVKATLETQERLITEERIAEIQELMGIDATGFSAREMIDLLKSPAPLTKYNEPNIRALVSRAFDAYKSIIEQELKSGIDAFTGEPVYYTAAERKAIREFMEMDTDKMPTAKEGLDAVDSLINFLANKSTAKMMSVTAKYNGQQNAKKVVAKKIESVKLKKLFMPGLARTLAEQTTNLNIVFEKMFKGFNRSRIVMEAMGLLDFINRKAYAQNKSKIIVSDYIKTFYKKGVRPNGQAFNTAYNEAERGMAAFMMRNVIGTPEQRAIEFDRRKRLIQQSIDALRTGNEKEQKKSKIYEEAYNKVLADAEGINDIIANTDKINLDAIDYWHKQWNANFEQMASTSIGIYNKILERESNYSPDRFSKLSEFAVEQIKLDEETSAFHTNNGTLYKRAAGSLQKAERPSNLGEFNEDGDMSKVKHYIDLSFDRNNSNSMYDALVDIETAASIRQVQAFMNSDDFRKIVPYSEDRALLTNRINLYIRKSRGKESYSDDELSKFMRVLNKVSTIGVGQALGGVTQPAKQVIPIAFNTIINGGGLNVVSVFDKDFSTWLESLGMPISNRGIQSQTEVDNINAKIQEAADSKGEQLLNLIESANKQWLKIFLVAPDVFIARASWKGYYEKALAKQGIDIKGLDYSTHEVNMEAANYAQGMVDRQQNISDHDMSGKAFVSTDVAPQILVKSLMAFASFRMNAASRTAADLSTIGHWSVSTKEDKAIALKSLAGYAVEQAVFKSITVGISLAIGSLALSAMGKDEDDDEFEKRKNNLIKGAATGAVTDIISPVPVTDKVMQELAAWTLDQTQSLVGVSDEDKLSLFGTIKEGFLKGAGTFGIAIEKASQLIDLVDLSYSGTYIDDYGKEKKITEKDREALSMFILPAIMTNIGLAPSEVSSLVRNVVKSSKKAYKTDAERAEAEQKDREETKENREKINALVELKSNTSSSAEIDYINKKIRELNLEGEEKKEFKKAKEEENKIKNAKKERLLDGFENQSDMKKYAPEKWERNFGEGSEWYRENSAEMKVNKNLRKEEREEKEDLYNYVEPSKSKKKSTGWGTVTKKKSTGWGSANKKKNKGWGSK